MGRADLMAATVFMSAFILMPKEIGILSGVAMAIFSIFGSLFKETGIMAAVSSDETFEISIKILERVK